jgi:sulfur carrier protein ThiS
VVLAKVILNGNLKQFVSGTGEFELDVHNVRTLFRVLGEQHPQLKPHLEEGVAVAIDGQIYQDDWLQPIYENSEVHLLPALAGG